MMQVIFVSEFKFRQSNYGEKREQYKWIISLKI